MDIMFGSKRRIKPMTLNSINGYASEVSLVCLFLVLQIVSFFPYGTQCLAPDDTEYGSQKNIQDINNCHDGS